MAADSVFEALTTDIQEVPAISRLYGVLSGTNDVPRAEGSRAAVLLFIFQDRTAPPCHYLESLCFDVFFSVGLSVYSI